MKGERRHTPSTDSGNGSEQFAQELYRQNYEVFIESGQREQRLQSGGEKSAEYYRYSIDLLKLAEENMIDRKKVITNPGWHAGKSGLHQVPIDMENISCQPGFGMEGNTCCEKTAIFCGAHCGCPSSKEFRIGTIRVLARVIMVFLVWAFAWSVTFPPCATKDFESQNSSQQEDCVIPGLPGSSLFGILMVFLWGMIAESLIVLIPMPSGLPPLPALLGSLLVGILLNNVNAIKVANAIDPLTSSRLRNMALGIILGRAGLEVDKKQMYKLRWVVPRLAFLPCIIEACSYGIFGHIILGLPWDWSFVLGFVCGAVAPACVVPSMIRFQEEGYGVEHGVPSLLIAGASIDDIVAINVFNILLLLALEDGGDRGVGYGVGIAVLEIVVGVVGGCIGGLFLQKVPDRRQHNVIRDRTFLLIAISFVFIFASDGPIELAGAGTLGTLTCSFVSAIGWSHRQSEAVAHNFKAVWFYFQPLLFGLTGATVDISLIKPHTVGSAIGCMMICLAIRLTVAGNAVSFLGWSHKEKFMTAISWIPKATVQAAIGGTALSKVILKCGGEVVKWKECANYATTECVQESCFCQGTEEEICTQQYDYALIILEVSVLLILITAPIGVFLIGAAGPKLLPRYVINDNTESEGKDPENAIENHDSNEVKHSTSPEADIENQGQDNRSYSKEGDSDQCNTKL